MFCNRRPGLLISTMRSLDNLELNIQHTDISCFNVCALDIFRAEVLLLGMAECSNEHRLLEIKLYLSSLDTLVCSGLINSNASTSMLMWVKVIGSGVNLDVLSSKFAADTAHTIKAIAIVHNETAATGVTNKLAPIRKLLGGQLVSTLIYIAPSVQTHDFSGVVLIINICSVHFC